MSDIHEKILVEARRQTKTYEWIARELKEMLPKIERLRRR